MNTTTTIPTSNQENRNAGQAKTEMEARDRIETLVLFIRAQLDHAKEDFDTAAEGTDKTAAVHGFCAIEIAKEYLDELAKLEEREFGLPVHNQDRTH